MERAGVLLVANFAHAPNLDGAVWLVAEVMPRVWAEAPGIRLTIAGADLPASVRTKLSEPRVRLPETNMTGPSMAPKEEK